MAGKQEKDGGSRVGLMVQADLQRRNEADICNHVLTFGFRRRRSDCRISNKKYQGEFQIERSKNGLFLRESMNVKSELKRVLSKRKGHCSDRSKGI